MDIKKLSRTALVLCAVAIAPVGAHADEAGLSEFSSLAKKFGLGPVLQVTPTPAAVNLDGNWENTADWASDAGKRMPREDFKAAVRALPTQAVFGVFDQKNVFDNLLPVRSCSTPIDTAAVPAAAAEIEKAGGHSLLAKFNAARYTVCALSHPYGSANKATGSQPGTLAKAMGRLGALGNMLWIYNENRDFKDPASQEFFVNFVFGPVP